MKTLRKNYNNIQYKFRRFCFYSTICIIFFLISLFVSSDGRIVGAIAYILAYIFHSFETKFMFNNEKYFYFWLDD